MGKLTEGQMKEVLQLTIVMLEKLNELWGLNDPLVPRLPVTPRALLQLTASVRHPLPPTYVQLLSIHDGIDNFYGISGDLLSSSYRFDFPDFEKRWERPHLFIFIKDNDWNAVAFDTNTRNEEGEMEVVEISDNVDADRWSSLCDFLVGYRGRVEGWLAGELADRAKANDD